MQFYQEYKMFPPELGVRQNWVNIWNNIWAAQNRLKSVLKFEGLRNETLRNEICIFKIRRLRFSWLQCRSMLKRVE